MDNNDLLKYKEVASLFRLPISTLRKAVRHHELQAHRITKKTVLLSRTEVERWLAAKRTKIVK